MDSINLMMEEHRYILRMLAVVRKACLRILKGEAIPYDDFDLIIDFIRSFADAHHHGKEEKLLFNKMVSHLGPLGDKLITHGMLVEHDLGRLFIRELDEALKRVKSGDEESRLDVIAYAIGYADLLKRHIDKEDTAVYAFAKSRLSGDIIEQINNETADFEKEADEKGITEYYKELLKDLEQKYLKEN